MVNTRKNSYPTPKRMDSASSSRRQDGTPDSQYRIPIASGTRPRAMSEEPRASTAEYTARRTSNSFTTPKNLFREEQPDPIPVTSPEDEDVVFEDHEPTPEKSLARRVREYRERNEAKIAALEARQRDREQSEHKTPSYLTVTDGKAMIESACDLILSRVMSKIEDIESSVMHKADQHVNKAATFLEQAYDIECKDTDEHYRQVADLLIRVEATEQQQTGLRNEIRRLQQQINYLLIKNAPPAAAGRQTGERLENRKPVEDIIHEVESDIREPQAKIASTAVITREQQVPITEKPLSEANWDRFKFMVKQLPKYSGFPGQSFERFESILREFATSHKMGPDDTRIALKSCLLRDSPAWNWIENEIEKMTIDRKPMRNFEEWMTAMRQRFGIEEQDKEQQAKEMRQRPDESADEYVDRKVTALKSAGITNRLTILRSLETGVLDQYKSQLVRNRGFFEREEDINKAIRILKDTLKSEMTLASQTLPVMAVQVASTGQTAEVVSEVSKVLKELTGSLMSSIDSRFRNIEQQNQPNQAPIASAADQRQDSDRPPVRCFTCHKLGHISRFCPEGRRRYSGSRNWRSGYQTRDQGQHREQQGGHREPYAPRHQGNGRPGDQHAGTSGDLNA